MPTPLNPRPAMRPDKSFSPDFTAAATPATPATPAILALGFEASTYPHLVDLIFSHADAHDLLHLRTACRLWRQVANAALSTHLTFLDNTVYAVGRQGDLVPHPAFEPSLPAPLKWQQLRKPSAHLSSDWTVAVAGVQVVDCIDKFKYDPPKCSSEDFPSVPFIRFWESRGSTRDAPRRSSTTPRSHTVVFFAWRYPNLSKIRPGVQLWTPLRTIHPDTRKLVINLSPATAPPKSSHYHIVPFQALKYGNLDEIVFSLASAPAGDSSITPGYGKAALWSYLPDLLRMIGRPRTLYTFVNTAALPRDLLPGLLERDTTFPWMSLYPASCAAFKTSTSFQEAAEAYLEELRVRKWRGWEETSRVQFLTPDEYEARVGTETYRIETMERPWGF